MKDEKLTYRMAGVNMDLAKEFVKSIKKIAKSTFRSEVISDIGGFSGLFSLSLNRVNNPVLVASTDGVGTKLKIAFMMNKHDTIGIDLVAMCINDIIVTGAEPLFFLDYFACGKLDTEIAEKVIEGIAKGCMEAGCSLIGGETAEMPSFYAENEYDLAGFAVGVVDAERIIDGTTITVGQKIIGIASSGLHSNGFSLARKLIFEKLNLKVTDFVPDLGRTIGEELLFPTRIYAKSILRLTREFNITGIAHITGGGLTENISRILPYTCKATIFKNSWKVHPIFHFLQREGNIPEDEMFRTFNNGIGMILIVHESEAEEIMIRLNGLKEEPFLIGEISVRKDGDPSVEFV